MAPAISGPYVDALRREILRSEQKRMRAVAVILTILLLVLLSSFVLLPGLRQRLFPHGISLWTPIAAVGPFILVEVAVLGVIRWRIAADKDFPPPARFVNALVETSLPAVVILVLARHMEPHYVLGFWPPLLYFVFIVLSTLRLDFWLSLWTGLVAAVEQAALSWWLLPVDSDRVDQTIYYHLSRSVILLLAGVVAGVVAQSLRPVRERGGGGRGA